MKTDSDGETFKSQEHICSASVGGKTMLLKGFVCDTCNEIVFSKLENDFINYSLISLPRQFYGPGSRGSLSFNKASKTSIHLLTDVNSLQRKGLGYISMGCPHFLNQFIITNDQKINFICGNTDQDASIIVNDLKSKVATFDSNNKYSFIELSESEYTNATFISFDKRKFYIADRTRENALKNIEFIKGLIVANKLTSNFVKEFFESHTLSHQKIGMNLDNDSRLIVKYGFNLFAYCRSHDYILSPKFDNTRNYVHHSGNEHRNPIITDGHYDDKFKSLFPDKSHFLFLVNHEYATYIIASFYGFEINYAVKLFDFIEDVDMIGLVIDWKNQKDILLSEHLKNMCT